MVELYKPQVTKTNGIIKNLDFCSLKLGQKSLIGVEKSDFSRLQDPSGNPVYQQGVTSVCVTSRGFLEAEPVIAGAGGGGTLPHRGSFAPPSGFCSFVPPPPSTSSFSPPSSLLLSFELCSVTPHLSLLYQGRKLLPLISIARFNPPGTL